MKWMVWSIVVVDTLNSIVSSYVAYDYSVSDFGEVTKILKVTPLFGVMVLTTAITGSIVQTFFGFRVKWLTGNRWIGWIIIFAAFLQFLCGVGTITGGYIVKEFVRFQEFRSVVILWLVLAPVTDLVISGALVLYLRTSRTGFATTDDLLSRLTRLTIQTGLITAVWALVDLVLFLVFNNNWHFVFNMALAKLYGNCLLSSLNARTEWSEKAARSNPTQTWSQSKGVHVTTSRGVHLDSYEMSVGEVPRYPNQVVQVSPKVIDIHNSRDINRDSKKTMDDGLSLRDSLSDVGDNRVGTSPRSGGQLGRGGAETHVDWRGMI